MGQVFAIHREFTSVKSGKKSQETVYGITSLTQEKAGPEKILALNRGHWSIENSLHYVRDMAFDEDRSQIRTKNAPQIMACLRNFAISFLRRLKNSNIAKALREMAARPRLCLNALGF